ncbi:MAG: glutamine-hydrolyzing carbamoyl-phosphate synthase small subunit [Atopobiaceae bacterium]
MNLLVDESRPRALLALENGQTFAGYACGAEGETFGEIVFNTSMVGYDEIVSDPSYAGQIVTLTYPQVGNYGVAKKYLQAPSLALRGLVVHDMCYTPSNWQSELSLPDLLVAEKVVAIEGVDTRALTLAIREAGAMRAAISTTDLDPISLVARVRASQGIQAHNFVADVSPREERVVAAQGEKRFSVVAYDCGMKQGIVEGLCANGCEVTIVPFDTPASRVLDLNPDGVFFSNGPGDPEQVVNTSAAARELLGKIPAFGICLGNQMFTLAAGGKIEKLSYGHHGGNEPVMNLLTGKVEITAQNHNYGTVFSSMGNLVSELSGGEHEHHHDLRYWTERHIAPVVENERFGRIRLTHVNLNDGTPEGVQFMDIPAFSVQYHPESKPGPNDSSYLFVAFSRLMAGVEDYLDIDVREGRRF